MAKKAFKVLSWRELRRETSKEHGITVVIGAPSKDGEDWKCPFQLRGLEEEIRYAHGVDSLQALQEAVYGAGLLLRRSGVKLRWVGEIGWLGFPMRVPDAHGQRFTRRIERMIEQEQKALFDRNKNRKS